MCNYYSITSDTYSVTTVIRKNEYGLEYSITKDDDGLNTNHKSLQYIPTIFTSDN